MLKNENYNKQLLIGLIITLVLIASFSFQLFGEDARIVEVTELYVEESLLHGQALFAENCASCHGTQGEGIVGPALNDKSLLEGASNGVIFAAIQTGRPNTTMPAWGQAYGGALTDEDIHAIVDFIRAYEADSSESQTSADEPGLYKTELTALAFKNGGCGGCHIIPGVISSDNTIGPDLSEIGRLAESRIQSGEYSGNAKTADEYMNESLTDPNAFISPDCPTGPCPNNLMPSFTEILNDQETQAVIDYLVSLPDGAVAALGETEDSIAAISTGPELTDEEFSWAKQTFFDRCAGCHGTLRKGATGPALTPDTTLTKGTLALSTIIFNGTPRGMPDWGKQGALTQGETEIMAKYLQNEPPIPPELSLEQMLDSWNLIVPPDQRPSFPANNP